MIARLLIAVWLAAQIVPVGPVGQALIVSVPVAMPAPTAYYLLDVRVSGWQEPTPTISIRIGTSVGDAGIWYDYTGSDAVFLRGTINHTDFTKTSLEATLLQRLVTDGKLPAGSVTGVPR